MKLKIESRRPAFRRLFAAKRFGSMLAAALLLGGVSPAMGDVTLRGNVGPRTIDDNVVIARGTACVLKGTIIKGNVRVLAGARLQAVGARILGNVEAFDSRLVDLTQATRVNGDVQGEGTRSIMVRGNTRVGGNVQLTECSSPANADVLLVQNSTVIGNIQVEKSTGKLRALDNTINGNLQFVENRRGPYSILNNRIRADLQFFKNQGLGTITGNRVGGNLQSKENSPSPFVRRNVVAGSLEVE